MMNAAQFNFFAENGYLIVENVLTTVEIEEYRQLYEDFLSGKIDTKSHRSDLSGESRGEEPEKIVQIMRPSLLHPPLIQSILHQKTTQMAQQLLGNDMAIDFDMLIDKFPYTNTPTPWHQDEAYWVNMPDKRAVTCWVALDDVVKENGCMWFVPKSNQQPIRPHRQAENGGALQCDATETEAVAAEIKAGSCTFHSGRTLHYARGNATNRRRRAFIVNFRPKEMIAFERAQGFDHLGKREVRSSNKK